jgi:hypothetical protein
MASIFMFCELVRLLQGDVLILNTQPRNYKVSLVDARLQQPPMLVGQRVVWKNLQLETPTNIAPKTSNLIGRDAFNN